MLQTPNSHNHFTFTLALKACSLLHSLPKAQEIHAHVIKTAYFSDVYIQNSFIHFYLLKNDIVSSCRVFDSVLHPDVVSWTSIISGLSKCGLEMEALDRFSKMDVNPNSTTIVTVLSACISIGAVKIGKSVYCYSLKNFDEDNVVLGNVVLDFYVKFGSIGCARYLFDNMCKRDVVSWTTMVGGFVQRGFFEVAVRMFQEMVQVGEAEPNEATIVSMLSACSSIGDLNLGQWVHSYVCSRHDLVMNRNVGNALVNLYVKCGKMDLAIRMFCMLESKDLVSWSTMISGLAMNGYGKHVLPLLSLMLIHGNTPDDVTFIGLLSACSHAGLVNQGLMLFKSMDGVYGISPHMKHYACIVDMYGRAGLLEEAERFIKDMPVEADGSVWGALLNACHIYGSEEMILRIRQSLSKTRDVTIGTYALLSNTYASSNRWDDANKVRDSMRCMGLKKTAGCSWVEVD